MSYLDCLPPEPLACRTLERVTLTPAVFVPTALPTRVRFGAFDAAGQPIEAFRLRRGDGLSLLEEAPPADAEPLPGTWLYGGILEYQYGAFLVETLARHWLLRRHPGLSLLFHTYDGRTALMPWQREVLAMLGIPEGRLRLITTPVRVERVLLGDAGCVLERWLDPQHARSLGVFPFARPPRRGLRVWLSRAGLRDGLAKVRGEAELEAHLSAAGWRILRPETMPVWQQLAALAEAETIAGFEGSAFHTLLLAEEISARVTLYARGEGRVPRMHGLIAEAKQFRQDIRVLPLSHIEGTGRVQVMALEDPFAAACTVEPACAAHPPAAAPATPPVVRAAPDAKRRAGAPPLAFVHVPKTAGTSFTEALRQGWPEARIVGTQAAFDAIPIEELHGLDLIAGHFYAYRLEERSDTHFVQVTVLRDPFERLFSAYRFGRHFAARGAQVGPAMRLAGEVDFGTWADSAYGAAQAHAQLYQLGLSRGDQARPDAHGALLGRAKARLDAMLVGLADRLEDSVGLVFRTLGRGPAPPVGRAKETADRYLPETAGLTAAQRAALEERLRPDAALYAYGRDLLLRRLDAAGV